MARSGALVVLLSVRYCLPEAECQVTLATKTESTILTQKPLARRFLGKQITLVWSSNQLAG